MSYRCCWRRDWLAACGGTVGEEPVSEAPAQVAQAEGESGRPTGALRWAHLLTGPDDNSGSLVRDRDGGFLAMVNFIGSIDLGEGAVLAPGGSSSAAVALARYDVQGRLRWVKVLGAPPDLQGRAFGVRHAVDRHRNIILFLDADNVDFGEGVLLCV